MIVILKDQELHTSEIADAVHDGEAFSEVLAAWLNRYDFAGASRKVGQKMVEQHRTLQGNFVRFCLDALVAYADQYEKDWRNSTDLRNEVAVKTANDIKCFLEDGTLQRPPFM